MVPHQQRWLAQRLEEGATQAAHAAPPMPHSASWSPALQALPLQQPAQPEVASQMHAPPLQRRPAPQAGPPPHWQPPEAEQPSPFSGLAVQSVQAPPAGPQAEAERAAHVESTAQQPDGQVAALQTQALETHAWPGAQPAPAPQWQAPPLQEVARPAAQAWHAAPPVPQADIWSPARHAAPEQQPGQVAGSHVQAPDSHR